MALSQRTQGTSLGCRSTSRQPRCIARLGAASSSTRPAVPRRSGAVNVTNSLFGARLPKRLGASAHQNGRAQLQPQGQGWSPFRPGPKPAGPHIAASLSVRGRRIIITAALAGVADSPADSSSSSSSEAAAAAAGALLSAPVKANQELITGALSNGLRYVLLPNPSPPQRFEAHLEVHAGSVDEREHEQGVAHLVEHVTFLGSKRRESLLGTGARANAYTDFHHTVFHVHAPVRNAITNTDMLPQVLEALAEIAFEPQFLPTRIEKERKAVLAEAQMMNTIEYRIDCQLLTHLHAENNLGCRFPIGKTEQVKTWPYDTVQTFWRKWYFPANVTLYIVGDTDGRSTEQVVDLIEKFFGKFTPGQLQDHGEEAAAALLASDSSSSSSNGAAEDGSNGHAAEAASANGSSSSSNGSSSGSNGAPELPVTVLPETPDPSRVISGSSRIGEGSSWADYVIPNGDESSVLGDGVMAVATDGLKLRHPVRPPVVHRHGCGPMAPGEPAAVPVNIFRHPLLQDFMLTVFCKLPVVSLKSLSDLRHSFIVRILLSAFQFRINQRYVKADPPFISIGLDISDSGREGCAVSTLTITCQPAHWKGTVQVAVEEMRRLQRYGLTPGELDRYISATMKDSAQLAEQAQSVPSINSLDFVMESLALGHTIMSHRDAHDAMGAVAQFISVEEVNAVARSLLTFASDVGREAEVLELAGQPDQEGLWARPGPTRATSVVACVPAYVSSSGEGMAVGGAHLDQVSRGGMGASGHLDADAINLEELEAANKQTEAALEAMKAPEGTQEFQVTADEILAVLACPDVEVEPPADVMLPEHLVPPERLAADMQALQPRFIPLEGDLQTLLDTPDLDPAACRPPTDPDTGITQRRLSNGLRVNYRHTDNEPKAGLLRIVASGGRASEPTVAGPGGIGSVGVGTRTLSEGGAMGDWSREEVEAFCIANLIHSVMDSNDEFLVLDIHFVSSNGGMTRAFELLHEVLTRPSWEEGAFERSKAAYINAGASVGKSLERATCSKITAAMLGPDPRFRDPEPEALDALTLEGVRGVLESQLHPANLELNVAGDFDEAELEEVVLQYLGTLQPMAPAPATEQRMGAPITFQDPPVSARHITWHLYDSDERAAAYIAGPAPCRWGPFGDREPLAPLARPISPPPPPATNPAAAAAATAARRRHPLYATITLQLLSEVINSRLFTTVRDSLGLTYDVSFEITTYDRLRAGWFSVCVTSYPDKIHEALAASLAVLRDIAVSPITPRELMRAKRTLITRHETDLKDNNYWLGLLTHLQSPDVPYKRVECLRDLRTMYESATTDDLYDAYTHFDFSDEGVFTVVGTSGQAPPPPPDRARLDRMFGRSSSSSSSSSSNGQQGQQVTQQAAAGMDWTAAFSKAFAAMQQQQQQVAGSSEQGQQQLQQMLQQQQQQQAAPPQGAAAPQAQAQQQQQKAPDPMAMLTALLAATQGKKLAEAMHAESPEQQQAGASGHADSSSNGSKQ